MFGVMQLRHYVLLIFWFSSPAWVGKVIMLVTHTARIGNWLCWISICWEGGLVC